MIKHKRDITTKSFVDDGVIIEDIMQYHYDNEDEKFQHKLYMEYKGFEDSGQARQNIGTITEPNHVWFGSYYRRTTKEYEKWRDKKKVASILGNNSKGSY